MEKYYLLIIQRKVGPQLVTNDRNKIILFSFLGNAEKKAKKVLDSGDYKAYRIDILPTFLNREDDVHFFEVFYEIEG